MIFRNIMNSLIYPFVFFMMKALGYVMQYNNRLKAYGKHEVISTIHQCTPTYFTKEKCSKLFKIDFDLQFQNIYTSKLTVKCYCISDLHADSSNNKDWIFRNCKIEDSNSFNVIIIPGDIGTDINTLKTIFELMTSRFDLVCYVPGNHEAWKKIGQDANTSEVIMAQDSLHKLKEVVKCAKSCGVAVSPVRVQCNCANDNSSTIDSKGGIVLFPLYSWYHSGWDTEPDLTHPSYVASESALPFHRKWGDFSLCSWPMDLITPSAFTSTDISSDDTSLAEAFGLLNEPFLFPVEEDDDELLSKNLILNQVHNKVTLNEAVSKTTTNYSPSTSSPYIQEKDTIISFSHFLPRKELCPEKRFLREPLLTRVIGSVPLEQQIRRLRPHLHLFGHTHIPIDMTLQGIRYIQWSLGYARESTLQCAPVVKHSLLLIYDSNLIEETEKKSYLQHQQEVEHLQSYAPELHYDINSQRITGIPYQSPSKDTHWSQYYSNNPRRPDVVDELSPWLMKRLEQYSGFVYTQQKRDNKSIDDE